MLSFQDESEDCINTLNAEGFRCPGVVPLGVAYEVLLSFIEEAALQNCFLIDYDHGLIRLSAFHQGVLIHLRVFRRSREQIAQELRVSKILIHKSYTGWTPSVIFNLEPIDKSLNAALETIAPVRNINLGNYINSVSGSDEMISSNISKFAAAIGASLSYLKHGRSSLLTVAKSAFRKWIVSQSSLRTFFFLTLMMLLLGVNLIVSLFKSGSTNLSTHSANSQNLIAEKRDIERLSGELKPMIIPGGSGAEVLSKIGEISAPLNLTFDDIRGSPDSVSLSGMAPSLEIVTQFSDALKRSFSDVPVKIVASDRVSGNQLTFIIALGDAASGKETEP
jgi:hypothetical protein